jgi:hypothetical protein
MNPRENDTTYSSVGALVGDCSKSVDLDNEFVRDSWHVRNTLDGREWNGSKNACA